ncbi:serine hydrolase [Edaphobacter aggregans]|uniref:serine hydrolase n=1 Tax=Edaphobacter aggregans TaxID=570835 RepID=UPI0005523BCB|nr:serine hydrolase [Edaphobacter aggregans]
MRQFAAVLLCLTPLSALAQTNPTPRMQQIIASYAGEKTFMGTVLVVKDGHTLIDQGYGSADLEWSIPNSPTTRFRLGSITKQFTAAGILLLQERGKLNIDDPVSKYMPDAPAAWSKITIYNVLTHTSGIPSFTGFPDYRTTEWKDTNPAELVARFRDKPLDFEPGTKFSYSNSGYVLLGYLIEKVSGQTYADFLQQNIFTPLGMKDTGIDSNAAILSQRAQGYRRSPRGIEHDGYISMTIPFSAGALYSTTGDLLKWEQALFGGKVLKPESLAKMTTPYKSDYGCGLFIRTVDGHKLITHGGGIEGFNTSLNHYPDDKLTIIVLGNLTGGAPDQVARYLSRAALGQPFTLPSERKEITLPATTLPDYAGTYRVADLDADLVIAVNGPRLSAKLGKQNPVDVFAESDSHFFLKVADAQVEFFRDPATHTISRLVIYQNGAQHEGKKQ